MPKKGIYPFGPPTLSRRKEKKRKKKKVIMAKNTGRVFGKA